MRGGKGNDVLIGDSFDPLSFNEEEGEFELADPETNVDIPSNSTAYDPNGNTTSLGLVMLKRLLAIMMVSVCQAMLEVALQVKLVTVKTIKHLKCYPCVLMNIQWLPKLVYPTST